MPVSSVKKDRSIIYNFCAGVCCRLFYRCKNHYYKLHISYPDINIMLRSCYKTITTTSPRAVPGAIVFEASEIIACREIYSVCIICLVIEIGSPAMQILYTQLHIIGNVIEEVCREILSPAIAFRVQIGIALA